MIHAFVKLGHRLVSYCFFFIKIMRAFKISKIILCVVATPGLVMFLLVCLHRSCRLYETHPKNLLVFTAVFCAVALADMTTAALYVAKASHYGEKGTITG